MGLKQGIIGQIQRRFTHDTLHHVLWVLKEPLVMGITRGAVSHHQGRLPRASGTTCTLHIVGGRRRDIAHIHKVKRRDIDTQLHGGRAEEYRQAPKALVLMLRQLFPFFDIRNSASKAHFQFLALVIRQLRGVLMRLKGENSRQSHLAL